MKVLTSHRRWLAVAIAVLIAGCANKPTYRTDFNEHTDFSSYQYYRWYDDVVETERGEFRHYNSSDKRIRDHVNAQLEKHGMHESATLAPDFLVNYSKASEDHVSINSFSGYPEGVHGSVGAGSYGSAVSIGYSSGPSVRTYREGTVVLDIIDARSKEVVWRGVAEGHLKDHYSIAEKDRIAQMICSALLANFPPPAGTQP